MLLIRDATPDDGELLARLDMEVFPLNCFNEKTLGTAVGKGGGYIAFINDEPVGYTVFCTSQGLVDIIRLGVLEPVRCQGLGKALLILAKRHARVAMLTVLKGNEPAIHIYKDHGFEIVGELPQADSWVMKTSA